jgi:hypothetical protein
MDFGVRMSLKRQEMPGLLHFSGEIAIPRVNRRGWNGAKAGVRRGFL